MGLVSAYNVEYELDNYNTLQPIEDVNVTIYNNSLSFSDLTDVHGIVTLTINQSDVYSVIAYKSGYATYNGIINVSNISLYYQDTIFLQQFSTAGIIRLTVVDLTFSEHRNCIYYSNGRLDYCYPLNETITIHNNMNYTWMPILTKTDLLTTPKGISNYLFLYTGIILGSMILFIIILIVVIGALKVGKNVFN